MAAVRATANVEFPGLVMFAARGARLTVTRPALLMSLALSLITIRHVRAASAACDGAFVIVAALCNFDLLLRRR